MELTPFTLAKIAIAVRLALSALGMVIGILMAKTSLALFGVLLTVYALSRTIVNFGALLRVASQERAYGMPRGTDGDGAGRLELPQQIFLVLFSVAEIDGRAGPRERAVIQQFLLQRFPDPRLAVLLSSWRAQPLPPEQLATLLQHLRARLSGPECETLFAWCCVVTLIDERFGDREREVLQTVARELGIEPGYARMLFHHAKEQVMSAGRAGAGGAGGARAGYGGPRAESAASRRARALRTLGLEPGASAEEIRRRHRELVKKHHPDAHSHLGPVAQQEATERFREIQAAYEELRDSA